MKIILLLVLVMAPFLPSTNAQGVFFGTSATVHTRIGTLDGPLAGTNILGQFFAGATTESLVPVGFPQPHGNGTIFAGVVTVPGTPAFTTAFVQLVAWDSMLWGTTFANVPLDQLGRTDIGTVFLTDGDFYQAPQFTQPAIVPIPEPSAWALATLGTVAAWLARRRRHRSPPS